MAESGPRLSGLDWRWGSDGLARVFHP